MGRDDRHEMWARGCLAAILCFALFCFFMWYWTVGGMEP